MLAFFQLLSSQIYKKKRRKFQGFSSWNNSKFDFLSLLRLLFISRRRIKIIDLRIMIRDKANKLSRLILLKTGFKVVCSKITKKKKINKKQIDFAIFPFSVHFNFSLRTEVSRFSRSELSIPTPKYRISLDEINIRN